MILSVEQSKQDSLEPQCCARVPAPPGIRRSLAVRAGELCPLAEEGSGLDRDGARWRWIIDPLDGTVNFAHGYPRFCVSIGVERDAAREVGVVYDPLLDSYARRAACAGTAARRWISATWRVVVWMATGSWSVLAGRGAATGP